MKRIVFYLSLIILYCFITSISNVGVEGTEKSLQKEKDQINNKIEENEIRKAVEKGLNCLCQGATNYIKRQQCMSCHHQIIPSLAGKLAENKGFLLPKEWVSDQRAFILKSYQDDLEEISKGEGISGGVTMAAYTLFYLYKLDCQNEKIYSALIDYLLLKQKTDGSLVSLMKRPPSEGSPFTNAALVIPSFQSELIRLSSINSEAAKNKRLRIKSALRKLQNWLESTKPENTEDKVFSLIAWTNLGNKAIITQIQNALLAEQNSDGSWSQHSNLGGDAYATSTVMFALANSGHSTKSKNYRLGIRFLIKNQDKSGAWLVKTRTRPVRTFFDNGDPGGKSQFITMTSTGWAVIAILYSL